MNSSLQTTAAIAKASLSTLNRNRRLLWFPVLSLAALVALSLALIPIVDGDEDGPALAAIYLVLTFAMVFFNAALTCEALRALRLQTTSVRGGLGCVSARLAALLGYTVIEASVGVVIAALVRFTRGRLPRFVLGNAWTLANFLTLPILIAEKRGAVDSVLRSGALLRKTWRETAVGELAMRLCMANVLLIAFVLMVILAHYLEMPVVIALFAGILLAVTVIAMTLEAIYRAALYLYVAEGVVPADFDTPEMHQAWKTR